MNQGNKRKRIIIFTLLCALVLGGVLASYAFFVAAGNNSKQEALTVNTGNIALTFNDGSDSFQGSLNFGESATKTFTIENTGSIDAKARMKWDNLVNTYLNGSLTYTLSYSETEDGEYTNIIIDKNVPRSQNPSTKTLADNLTIPIGQKYYYKLIITLNYLDDKDQTADLDAMLTTNFTLEDRTNIKTYTLMARPSASYTGEFWSQTANIKTVTFETEMNPKENAAYSYDISEAKDGSVMSHLVSNEEDSTKYDLYIQADGEIAANTNSSNLFANFTNLESIEGLENLDTRNVTNMTQMFYQCSKLIILNISNFDTSNVVYMVNMFSGCSSLTSLDLSNFDTSNTLDISSMFQYCSKLITLDVSNFDTSNVTNMNSMFFYCSNLTMLEIDNFDTSNVTNMGQMFLGCNNLTTLDLSNFDTGNVTIMSSMFSGCSNLTLLNLSKFNTSNVTDMSNMFYNCSKLITTIIIKRSSTYTNMFINAATEAGSQITVNYTADTFSLVDQMIATKSSNSNVVKGSLVAA